ncbi:YceI family protein [Burkholderia sp. LMU1-1-1.1]|uniref:YceI family protein n=1 Tax=Burkholderia sp. LMU1-1-1.1 TaxID=3135266 RepID=UPI00344868D0
MTHIQMTHSQRAPKTRLKTTLGGALLCALAACSQLRAPDATAPTPPPSATATTAAPPTTTSAPNAAVLRIDSANSLIAVTVRRGGVLARLGHDHVVASHTVTGTVAPAQNRADFQFRLDQLTVDEPDLRRVAGLEKQPSVDAIDGTRTNMLTKVLDAERYPLVSVRAARGAAGEPLRVAITLHGVTRDYAIPADLREDNGVMTVSGTVDLNQTDFGLVPFSVMGGAMAVQDKMELRFTLVAK